MHVAREKSLSCWKTAICAVFQGQPDGEDEVVGGILSLVLGRIIPMQGILKPPGLFYPEMVSMSSGVCPILCASCHKDFDWLALI